MPSPPPPTAVATYTGTATSSYVTGYNVSAEYSGTVSRIALDRVRYVAVFEGTEIKPVVTLPEIDDPITTVPAKTATDGGFQGQQHTDRQNHCYKFLRFHYALSSPYHARHRRDHQRRFCRGIPPGHERHHGIFRFYRGSPAWWSA